MGALEFVPGSGPKPQRAKKIEIDALVRLASEMLTQRKNLKATFARQPARQQALSDILRVGTSAGGARAKAVIAWNRTPTKCVPARSRRARASTTGC